VAGNSSCRGEAPGESGHAARRLQGVLRRHQPPHLVKVEPLQRFEADMAMAFMGRVEGAAKNADASWRQPAESRE
jgi:hypothetical protein